jgi:hypothetical protein
MSIKTMRARYPGRCAATGAPIKTGALIYYDGRTKRATLAPVLNTITLMGEHGPSHFTRNARGRCEDAPCCGCCTI